MRYRYLSCLLPKDNYVTTNFSMEFDQHSYLILLVILQNNLPTEPKVMCLICNQIGHH